MELKYYELHWDITEKYNFLMKFMESPTQVGSITPSSRFLAKKMIELIEKYSLHGRTWCEKVQSMGRELLNAVVSGLPFTLVKEDVRELMVDEVLHSLQPNGVRGEFSKNIEKQTDIIRGKTGFIVVYSIVMYICKGMMCSCQV